MTRSKCSNTHSQEGGEVRFPSTDGVPDLGKKRRQKKISKKQKRAFIERQSCSRESATRPNFYPPTKNEWTAWRLPTARISPDGARLIPHRRSACGTAAGFVSSRRSSTVCPLQAGRFRSQAPSLNINRRGGVSRRSARRKPNIGLRDSLRRAPTVPNSGLCPDHLLPVKPRSVHYCDAWLMELSSC